MIDLLTVGESLIRLSVPPGDLLSETNSLAVHLAGAESNVAVGVARLGHSARWLSRLTDNVWGRRMVSELTSAGVDCSGVAWTEDDRMGLYYLEAAAPPRASHVLYDRANSAASRMSPETFDLAQIAEAKMIHLTGITAALSDSCYAMVKTWIECAHERGIPVVFDVNFRARLWSAETCAERLSPLLPLVDTLIIGMADALAVFGLSGQPNDILRALQDRFAVRHVALTLGAAGAVGLENNVYFSAPGYAAQVIDRIGAGDAFAAGVIAGLLRGDFALGLRYGVAMSALKISIRGDMFRFSLADVQRLIDSGVADRPLR